MGDTSPEFAGRVALVTGAGRGLGAALVRELAARGARCALLGRTPADLAAVADSLGAGHSWHQADVRDDASLRTAIEAAVERHGRLDVLVANAGVNRHGSAMVLTGDEFADVVDTNLTGTYRTVRHALPHLLDARGYLLVVSSVAAFAAVGGMGAYAASKAGGEMLAHTLHLELDPHGVGVGIAHPTWIATDLVDAADAEIPALAQLRNTAASMLGLFETAVPGGLPGSTVTPAECARALVDGIRDRRRRIWVPPAMEELWRARTLLAGDLGEGVTLRLFAAAVEQADEGLLAARGRTP